MKRANSCPPHRGFCDPPNPVKRRQLSTLKLSQNPSNLIQTLPLTPETLEHHTLQSSEPRRWTQSIEEWQGSFGDNKEVGQQSPEDCARKHRWSEDMAQSEHGLRSTQRRVEKQLYRQSRRSPDKISPTRSSSRKNSPSYRLETMQEANIFVDQHFTLPQHAETQVLHVFGVTSLDSIGAESHDDTSESQTVAKWAHNYLATSRKLAQRHVGEGEWKDELFVSLMKPMAALWEDLHISSAEKPWREDLRPRPTPNEEIFGEPLVEEQPDTLTTPANIITGAPFWAPPSIAPSDVTTDNPNLISRPKPDITVGLDKGAFSKKNARILLEMQDRGISSDPHQSPIGLRFPFLMVEAKGLSQTISGAQNQAAGDASCALVILDALDEGASITTPHVVFSIVTEGPIHELWVHYRVNEAFYMTQLRHWRTTYEKDSLEFVRTLWKILRWGAEDFKSAVERRVPVWERDLRNRGVI